MSYFYCFIKFIEYHSHLATTTSLVLIDLLFLLLNLWKIIGDEVIRLRLYVFFFTNMCHFPFYKGVHFH